MHVIYQVSQNLALQVELSPDTVRSVSYAKGKTTFRILQLLEEAHCQRTWAQGSNKFLLISSKSLM